MKLFHRFSCLAVLVFMSACTTPRLIAPPPTLYSADMPYPDAKIAEPEKRANANLIFMTDRRFETDERTYGSSRSAAVHAGEVKVEIGDNLSWEDLIRSSHMGSERSRRPKLGSTIISSGIEFPETPIPFSFRDGVFTERQDVREDYQEAVSRFQNLVRERLNSARTDSVLVYVHGFNNSFEDAAHALVDLWHYSGRSTVPVMFSWPASEGNLFGYFTDRESGEFSIFHVKEMFRSLQGIDELEAIHVVAHSRGTDVTTTALRELVIEARAAGRSARKVLKIDNLILAAPDLDLEVVKQRLIAERFGPAIGQITIYTNPNDTALGLSSFVARGVRFGQVTSGDLGERVEEVFRGIRNVHFVNASHIPGVVGHSYFRTHPGVLADISVVLQTSAPPASTLRPLTSLSGNFYRLGRNYQPRLYAEPTTKDVLAD